MPLSVKTQPTENDSNVLFRTTCDSGVAVGDWVRVDASGVIQQALADTIANAHVFGVVEKKQNSTTCNVRTGGISSAIFSSLDETSEYFLSDSTPGGMSTSPPDFGSGSVAISLGVPASDTKFKVEITNLRTQR